MSLVTGNKLWLQTNPILVESSPMCIAMGQSQYLTSYYFHCYYYCYCHHFPHVHSNGAAQYLQIEPFPNPIQFNFRTDHFSVSQSNSVGAESILGAPSLHDKDPAKLHFHTKSRKWTFDLANYNICRRLGNVISFICTLPEVGGTCVTWMRIPMEDKRKNSGER